MTGINGRTATQPYRVRAADVWYWVDPTVPAAELAPGDTVVIYPATGDATLAILQSPFKPSGRLPQPVDFATLEGERFTAPAGDITALHLAAVDEDQT